MFEPLVESVEASFEKFSIGRILYLVFLIGLGSLAFYVFNETTGYGVYTRLDKQISALERLHALEQKGIAKSPQLAPLYRNTVRILEPVGSVASHYVFDSDPLIKLLAAAGIPLGFALSGLIQLLRGRSESGSMFGGAIVTALILGLPAIFVPRLFGSLGLTVALLFTIQAAFIRWLMVRGRKTKQGAN